MLHLVLDERGQRAEQECQERERDDQAALRAEARGIRPQRRGRPANDDQPPGGREPGAKDGKRGGRGHVGQARDTGMERDRPEAMRHHERHADEHEGRGRRLGDPADSARRRHDRGGDDADDRAGGGAAQLAHERPDPRGCSGVGERERRGGARRGAGREQRRRRAREAEGQADPGRTPEQHPRRRWLPRREPGNDQDEKPAAEAQAQHQAQVGVSPERSAAELEWVVGADDRGGAEGHDHRGEPDQGSHVTPAANESRDHGPGERDRRERQHAHRSSAPERLPAARPASGSSGMAVPPVAVTAPAASAPAAAASTTTATPAAIPVNGSGVPARASATR